MKILKRGLLLSVVGIEFVIAYFVFIPRLLQPPMLHPVISEAIAFAPILRFDFPDASILREWKEYLFRQKTMYTIQTDTDGSHFLDAHSRDAGSAIYQQADISMAHRPFLVWEWRAPKFPSGKSNARFSAKGESDYAARVYVVFHSRIPLFADMIQYIWDDHFPPGTRGQSASARNIKMLVVKTGPAANANEWILERRDLVKDYELLFGKPPHADIVAVGVMSDSDDTHTESEIQVRTLGFEKPLMEGVKSKEPA